MSIQFSAREIRSVIASIEDRLGRVHGVYNTTVDDPSDQKMLRELIERFKHELEELAAHENIPDGVALWIGYRKVPNPCDCPSTGFNFYDEYGRRQSVGCPVNHGEARCRVVKVALRPDHVDNRNFQAWVDGVKRGDVPVGFRYFVCGEGVHQGPVYWREGTIGNTPGGETKYGCKEPPLAEGQP